MEPAAYLRILLPCFAALQDSLRRLAKELLLGEVTPEMPSLACFKIGASALSLSSHDIAIASQARSGFIVEDRMICKMQAGRASTPGAEAGFPSVDVLSSGQQQADLRPFI